MEDQKNFIIKNSERYLGQEINLVLSGIKKIIDDNENVDFQIKNYIENLDEKLDEKTELKTQKQFIEENADKGLNHIKYNEKVGELKLQIKATENVLDTLNSNKIDFKQVSDKVSPDQIKNIKTCKEIIKNAENDLYVYSDSVKLKGSLDKFRELIKRTKEESQKIILNEIKEIVQKNIDEIYQQKHLIAEDRITIEKVDKYVHLNRGLSQGQKVAFTYAFLSAAQSYASIKMPFVVDTPTGEMGFKFRNSVGKLIPKFTNQFMVFVQPAEKDNFIGPIRVACNHKCSNTTILDSSEEWFQSFKNSTDFDKSKVKYTMVGKDNKFVVIEGTEAFDQYSLPKDRNSPETPTQ